MHSSLPSFPQPKNRTHHNRRHPTTMSSALKKLAGPLLRGARSMSAAADAPGRKVAIMGAAGGIGQPLSLLMKVGSGRAGVCTRRGRGAARRRLFLGGERTGRARPGR
jgi:hypothetical protein